MPRIAIAGFQHETNTFAATKTGFRDFEVADSWPPLLTGQSVISGTRGMNIPIAGFAAAAGLNPAVELVPLFWCAAEPAAHVTDDAFERISKMLIDGLRAAGAIDGLYLDLHGAMVTESYEDGEGELLRRVRGFLGDDLPISVSLDLHANVTPAMVHRATSLTIFRTYPHLDMADTGARNLALLLSHIAGTKPKKAFRQVPYLIPLSAQYTGVEPCRSLYAAARRFSARPGCSADIALGFSAADIADAGPAIVAFAQDQETADSIADELLMAFLAAEEVFDCHLYSPAEAVRQALDMRAGRPVVIADVQDNPGAGGTSDSTGMLSALIEEGAQGALIGLLHDAEIAAKAHAAGIGARIEGALGGKSGWPGQVPYNGHFRVAALGDGNCRYTGEMYGGSIAVLGPTAVLTIEDVRADVHVVVTSNRSQCLDLALFTHLGLNPKDARIICVKSTVHFRADFEPIAAAVLSAAAPGLFPCLLPQVPYSRLRDGLRLGPKGPAFKGR